MLAPKDYLTAVEGRSPKIPVDPLYHVLRSGLSVPVEFIALIPLPLLGASWSAAKLPRFEDYPVSKMYKGKVKAPVFGRERGQARCFTDPEGYVTEQVNFAGHFIIESCTCGSGCHSLFMWDVMTGKFYSLHPPGIIQLGPFGAEGPATSLTYKGEQFRKDSSLLIVDGCVEDTCDCATRYYAWNRTQFKLISRQPVHMPPNCTK